MTRSTSALFIDWIRPKLAEEDWEFFSHPSKQPFYGRHSVTWERLVDSFEGGRFEPYPRSGEIAGIPVELSHHSHDDYCRYLAKAKRGYRINYNRMENELQRQGNLTLPAAIILMSGNEAILFSGYRRLCLAWNYGMTPHVWFVPL